MSVFISYSSIDSPFVDNLAMELVKNRVHIWLDRWVMQVGDSLLEKIQEGLTESSYLLVVLSKESVKSDWCRKELNSMLMRELKIKKTVILPILIDDCEIPLFLQEKIYADFRTNFSVGFDALIKPLHKLISEHMGRITKGDYTTDFAINWGIDKIDHKFILNIDGVIFNPKGQKTILLQIIIKGDDSATERFNKQLDLGLYSVMKEALLLTMMSDPYISKLNILIQNDKIDPHLIKIHDKNLNLTFDTIIRGVVMGVDTGDDVIINLIDFLKDLQSVEPKTTFIKQ